MDNIPESARSGLDRVINYPDYRPSPELESALDDLAFMKENYVIQYGKHQEIDDWEQAQREKLESADFWGNPLSISEMEDTEFDD